MIKFGSLRKLIRWSDVIVIAIFLSVVAFLFHQSQPRLTWLEAIKSPQEVKEIMLEDLYGTPLHPEYNPELFSHRFKTFRISIISWLSEQPLTNRFVHYFNSMQSWIADCSSCSDVTEVCIDLEKIIMEYPMDIQQGQLRQMMNSVPDLMIVDVRDLEEYQKAHIPGSVNLPLMEMIDWIYPMDRWTEIVIVGDSYFQTKIGAEALRRLYFHRLHRLITPVEQWNGELESIL